MHKPKIIKSTLLMCFLVAIPFILVLCQGRPANTATFSKSTCISSSIPGSASTSVSEWVCKVCDEQSGAKLLGAAWFNKESAPNASSTGISLDIDESETSNGRTTAYVHGQFYACRGDASKDSALSMNANHVHIIKAVGSYYGNKHGWGSSFPNNLPFVHDVQEEDLLRTDAKDSHGQDRYGVEANTWSHPKQAISFTIDPAELKQYIDNSANQSGCYQNDSVGSMDCFEVNEAEGKVLLHVGVYRCPLNAEATTGHKDGCGSDNETLVVTYDNVKGKIKIKQKFSNDDSEEDDGSSSSPYKNIAYKGFDNQLHLQENSTYLPDASAVVDNQTINFNGKSISGVFVYTLKLPADGTTKRFNIKSYLKSGMAGVNAKYRMCDNTGCSTGYREYLTQGNQSEIETMKVAAKISSNTGKIVMKIGDGSFQEYDGNMYCRALTYKSSSASNAAEETRAACIKFEADPTAISVQGRIAVEASDTNADAKIKNNSTKTDFNNWTSSSDTKIVEKTYMLNNDNSKTVYAQYRFDAKTSVTSGQYRYRIIGCSSKNSDGCINWIEGLTVSSYDSVTNNGSISGVSESKTFKNGAHDINIIPGCAENAGCIIEYKEDNNTALSFELQKDSSLTVCYRLFVARNNADKTNNDQWNSSIACVKYKAESGDITGESHVRFTPSNYSDCTYSATTSTSTDGSGRVVLTAKATSTQDAEETITIQCPASRESVKVLFWHEVYTPPNEEIPNKIWVKGYHQSRRFYQQQVPSNVPGSVDLTLKSKNVEGDGDNNVGGSNAGVYNIENNGTPVCETLDYDGKKQKVCVKVTQGGGDELEGYTVAICSDGTRKQVATTINKESAPISCSPGTVTFEHHGSGGNVTSTRHRIYHNQCDGVSFGESCPGSVPASVDETVSGQIREGVNFTTHTNPGSYNLVAGRGICESQRFGAGDSARSSKVCVYASDEPDTCPGLSSLPSGYTGATVITGTSYTYSLVANLSVSQYSTPRIATETNPIYAKPTDKIQFTHCYLPGAQKVRTTKYWDKITEPAPASPLTGSQCDVDADEDGDHPEGCSPVPTFSLTSSNATSIGESTDFVVDTNELETLVEANYYKNKLSNNDYYNSYSISTTSYPGNSYSLLGNGVITQSSSSINDSVYGNGEIYMVYSGKDYTGTTGKEGETHIGVAQTSSNLFVTVGAPGGTLTQAISAHVGKVTRKTLSETWNFYFGYNYTIKYPEGDDGETPDDDLGTVSDYGNIDASDCSDDECKARGVGTGYHGTGTNNGYYGRDEDNTTLAYSLYNTSASVYIPYNYENTATVELDPNFTIYSGEGFTLKSATITVGTRRNNTTDGTYATVAPNITAKLYAYVSPTDDSSKAEQRTSSSVIDGCAHYRKNGLACTEIDSVTNTYNIYGSMSDKVDQAFARKEYNAFDEPAGYYMCVGLGMNPSTTYDTSVNYYSTYYSKPACQQIYKKPSFAVWGGSVFSNGNIVANKAEKRTIAKYFDLSTGNYVPYGKDRFRVFSSWVETGIVANGKVQGVASGAATAYTFASSDPNNYPAIPAPGGSLERNFCFLSPITIANSGCSTGTSGYADIGNNTAVKEEILNRYVSKHFNLDDTVDDSTSHGDPSGAFTYYTELTNTANTLPKNFNMGGAATDSNFVLDYGQTRIVASKYDINITHDITYPETYASANQLPQLIVYTKGNINISKNVSNLNGVFIAEGKINTCSEYNAADKGNAACSVPLRINGSIIGNIIEFNRTYGGATGANSIIPAEIVNYDPTLYMWSSKESNEDVTETVTETYTREIPPRQ